jgi:aspartate racemase
MKKIGIVGGIGWQSTVDYYSDLCHRAEQQSLAPNSRRAPSTPEMSIESLDIQKAISYLGSDDDEASWAKFDEYHRMALLRLAVSGADFALLASNTPHHRFATIVRGVGIPVIDLYAVIAEHCARIDPGHVLILGTAFTMKSQRLRNAFARFGVDATAPQGVAEQEVVQLIADLHVNRLADAAERIARIARISFAQSAAPQTVCLACTELLLAYPQYRRTASFNVDGVRYTNASALHMNAAFDLAMQ